MTVLIFSGNASVFSPGTFEFSRIQSFYSDWEKAAAARPDDKFIIATQLPGRFLLDIDSEGKITQKAGNIEYFVSSSKKAEDFAHELLKFKADLAIAASFWVTPYDWLSLHDSITAEILRSIGIKTVCHPADSALICFDKKNTAEFLKKTGSNRPESVYVHHELFWAERGRREIESNVYKEYVLSRVKAMKFPVIIKDTVGLSSYSMEVAVSYKQAAAYLNSGRTSSDRIVEEYIQGEHFGAEIYGPDLEGNYFVSPPFIFSLNKYGITSPKQSVKIGPINPMKCEKFKIQQMKAEVENLARELKLEGIAQADLIFDGEKWFVVEINTRLSGMSESYAASLGISLPELILRVCKEKNLPKDSDFKAICNMKMPLLEKSRLEEIAGLDFVKIVNQTKNLVAKQEREKGYAEVIFGGSSDFKGLLPQIEEMQKKFPDCLESAFVQKAREIISSLEN